ncbi:hypothetical protein ACIOHE_23830 [Streptomyces sp. NPDC087851]|uniref:hypothetical protein n=1 Tax=Streptomyces sp. NPDC087851 TaxID=3365810 RepID=UPI00382D2EBA
MSPTPHVREGPPLSGFDAMAQLRGLAEHIHRTADDMPLTGPAHAVGDSLDELEDHVRDIAGLIVHVTGAAAAADREARSHPGVQNEAARRRATALTHAAGTLGRALADLAEAVTHFGVLHQAAALPRSPPLARVRNTSRSLLRTRLDRAREHLHEAGRQLQHDAAQLSPPIKPRPTSVPAAAPEAAPAAARRR